MRARDKEIYDQYVAGLSQRKLAAKYGIGKTTVHDAIRRVERELKIDPDIAERILATGAEDLSQVRGGWVKEKGISYQFRLPEEQVSPIGYAERIVEALNGIDALPPLSAPESVADALCTIYPIADAHLGMRATESATGAENDLDIASERVLTGIAECMFRSPRSKQAVILDVGDLLHADDGLAQTPKSKHALDVSCSHYEAVDRAIKVLASSVELAAQHHENVLVRILRGNHDENAYIAVSAALSERYRDNPRIVVERTDYDFFVFEWGRCFFMAHHGDKAKAERLVMHMAAAHSEEWGRSKHRYYFTGHLHHAKAQDIGGVYVEQLRAATSGDAYSASGAYTSMPQLQAITFHEDDGEVFRVRRNF
jgi:hypothetical protein